jgi:hypothetical protein
MEPIEINCQQLLGEQKGWLDRENLRVKLVRGISAHHMHYSLVTAWMEPQPCVNLKDLLIHKNNSVSICN